MVLVLVGLAAMGTAQARELAWSVDLHSPGVSVGLGNQPQVIIAPGYYAPPPVVYAPRPMYQAPAVVMVPEHRGYYKAPKHHFKRHHRHHGHRHDRHDDFPGYYGYR